jgi:hypothetical protein
VVIFDHNSGALVATWPLLLGDKHNNCKPPLRSRPPSPRLQISTESKQFLTFNDFSFSYTEINVGSEVDVTYSCRRKLA